MELTNHKLSRKDLQECGLSCVLAVGMNSDKKKIAEK
jgi:hypothetical protein